MAVYSDDFNRANGPLSGILTVTSGSWVIVSNRLDPTTADATCRVEPSTSLIGADQYVEVDMVHNTSFYGPGVRIQPNGAGIYLHHVANAGTGWRINRFNGSIFIAIQNLPPPAEDADGRFRLEAVGNKIRLQKISVNPVVTILDWTEIVSMNATGQPGLHSRFGLGLFDNFEAGDVVSGPSAVLRRRLAIQRNNQSLLGRVV